MLVVLGLFADLEDDGSTLEVWEAVVQLQERTDGSAGVEYKPLSVKRKHAYTSTLTLSPAGLAMALGRGNATHTPLGFESSDMGLARNAP